VTVLADGSYDLTAVEMCNGPCNSCCKSYCHGSTVGNRDGSCDFIWMNRMLECMRAAVIVLITAPAMDRKEESRTALPMGFCKGSFNGSGVGI